VRKSTCAIFIGLLSLFNFAQAADDSRNPVNSNARFKIEKDTVLDQETGLRWQRCSSGQTLDLNGTCLGKAKKLGFFAAQKSINLNKQERKWRIPTKNEMKTIAGEFSLKNTANTSIFPDINKDNQFYWTCDMSYDGAAWYADMVYGGVHDVSGDYEFLDRKFNIRLVYVEK
jgi:hypothetical protein